MSGHTPFRDKKDRFWTSSPARASYLSMELLSWNVNGLRAVMKKGFTDFLHDRQPDIVCLQEIKAEADQIPQLEIPYPYQYYHSAEKKGYSGTAIFSRIQPLRVTGDMVGKHQHPAEGRIQTAEFEAFYLVNVYVPNSQDGLRRLDYRTRRFDPDFRAHLQQLAQHKPVVVCGDFNVAHQEIDIARPKENRQTAGFTDEERAEFTRLLESGLIDTFRTLNPEARHAYSWWSYRGGARERNVGWRIDYFLASPSLREQITDAFILPQVHGSDHCPVGIKLK